MEWRPRGVDRVSVEARQGGENWRRKEAKGRKMVGGAWPAGWMDGG
jgi:hypothetical protein